MFEYGATSPAGNGGEHYKCWVHGECGQHHQLVVFATIENNLHLVNMGQRHHLVMSVCIANIMHVANMGQHRQLVMSA